DGRSTSPATRPPRSWSGAATRRSRPCPSSPRPAGTDAPRRRPKAGEGARGMLETQVTPTGASEAPMDNGPGRTALTPLAFLKRSAEVFPGKTAYAFGDRRATYEEFAAETTR